MNRTELRKWRSPGVLATVATAVVLLFVLVGLGQAGDAGQWSIYTFGQTTLATPHAREVYCQTATSKAQCDRLMAAEEQSNEDLRLEIIQDHPYGAETQHPIGAGGIVAGWMASLFGLILVAALAAWLVSTEWWYGTARVVLARTPHRWRYAAVKVVSVWGAAVATMLVLWASLAAAGPILRALYDVAPADPGVSHLAYAVGQTGRALPVLALYAVLATGVALLVRNLLGAFAVTTLGGLVGIASSAASRFLDLSPGFWIASWMHYRPSGSWTERRWPSLFPLGNALEPVPLDAAVGLAGIVGTAVGGAIIVAIVFERRSAA